LEDDENTPMAVLMPIGVSVYETSDSEVYIAGMNLERMSMMFGGVVKEVLRAGAANYRETVDNLAEPEPDAEADIQSPCAQMNPKKLETESVRGEERALDV